SWRLQNAELVVFSDPADRFSIAGPPEQPVTSLHRVKSFLNIGRGLNGHLNFFMFLQRQRLPEPEQAVLVNAFYRNGHGSGLQKKSGVFEQLEAESAWKFEFGILGFGI